MSLPNYLSKIKSSGIYRFVWDKSVVPNQVSETLRLVVGYSEKGPFNTPVYIDKVSDFITIYGNVNKKLERKGIFFHRMALQALSAGPILALNLKPFGDEEVNSLSFDAKEISTINGVELKNVKVKDIQYKTNKNDIWQNYTNEEGLNEKSLEILEAIANMTNEEAAAYILKEMTEADEDTIYEMVEDDVEMEAISKVFEETLEDIDIEI